MNIKAKDFADFVKNDYGSEIGELFLSRFDDPHELIPFSEGMRALALMLTPPHPRQNTPGSPLVGNPPDKEDLIRPFIYPEKSIGRFIELVEEDYGSKISEAMFKRFKDPHATVPFPEAMSVLREVVREVNGPPHLPQFGVIGVDPSIEVRLLVMDE